MHFAVRSAAFVPSLTLMLALSLLMAPLTVSAQTRQDQTQRPPEPAGKEGLDYVILYGSAINLTSIGPTDEEAELFGAGIALGTYITDHFKVEIRGGGTFTEDTASYRSGPPRGQEPSAADLGSLDVSLPYYASWYLGLLYPWADFSHVYGQFGFSYLKGEADTATPRKFADIPDKLYGSSFSMSWLLGVDLELTDRAYLLLEGGRLHTDTDTNINTMQYSVGLRYEF